MKKIIKNFILITLLINLALTLMAFSGTAFADGGSLLNQVNAVGGKTGLNSFQLLQHPDSMRYDATGEGVGRIGSVAFFTFDLIKLAMSTVAVVMIIYLGLKLIFVGSNEESVGKIKKALMLTVLGLIVIQLADVLVTKVFFGTEGAILEDEGEVEIMAKAGVEQVRGLIGFVQLGLGAIAVLVIVINGIKIIVAGGEEESRKKSLKNVGVALGGLIVVGLSELLIKGFAFPEDGSSLPSTEVAKNIIVMLTNFVSGFIALIAFVVLLYSGYLYVVAGGEEQTQEKVKKLITGAILGIILAFSAYAITNTLITFKEDTEYSEEERLPTPTEDQK